MVLYWMGLEHGRGGHQHSIVFDLTQDCVARSMLGAMEMEIRLAIGLRMLPGGSYLDIAPRFGV